ncbi:MAG: MmgE/PrpD family protein [Phycisphaeraceae bacterium]|nr:MmgE/PrpD family protein [Phycisphaeraceae bacterium]
MPVTSDTRVVLPADTNQALGLGQFAVEFMNGDQGVRGEPDDTVLDRTNMFHTDAVLCGASALALGANSPTVLRNEALQYRMPPAGTGTLGGVLGSSNGQARRGGAPVFGSRVDVAVEKAILANAAAVREWDSNGTNFGYSTQRPHHRAGEFGHNDFYSVPLAAAQMMGRDGEYALRGMILLDEIRGRLAEVFSLKTYKIDHVVHGAIGSAAAFGAMMGATPEQIESAIGMFVAHFIPFRAIRHGHQLSDSKGASAAISTEAAIQCMKRSMAGFIGPKDIFRNPEAVFCLMKKYGGESIPKGQSPFDLVLSRAGSDFTVMGMHFKIGLYEHQSAGALQGLIDLIAKNPRLLDDPSGGRIGQIVVTAYEPAFSIIGDPHKRDPHTRQSADHSMLYLVCTMLRKALEARHAMRGSDGRTLTWHELMLLPHDFSHAAIMHPVTRSLMAKMTFQHGGPEYDAKYPDGIPTSMQITDDAGAVADSGLVMYPAGHARNTTADLKALLHTKWSRLGELAVGEGNAAGLIKRLSGLEKKKPRDIAELYDFEIVNRGKFE